MQIIVLHPRQPRVRSFTLTRLRLVVIGLLSCALVALSSAAATWYVARGGWAGPAGFGAFGQTSPSARDNAYLRENLAVLAASVGEMQARMVRLDALGERVSGLTGIAPQDFDFRHKPGRGGPEAGARAQTLTLPELQAELARLDKQAEHRFDYFDVLEGALLDREMRGRRIPRVLPVATGYDSSGFGARIDPFTGRRTQHDGVDFVAPAGTPIVAAAGGVVVASEWHHEYGNMIDIDHGNGLKTRYAHASKTLVKTGDLVRAGQTIAQVGSSGRSTGSHLHFEVHVDGVPRNPGGFLMAASKVPSATQVTAAAPATVPAATH